MTERTRERIAFDVETDRILQILSSEIYDSPKAFLRENVQNAYDAILMRCTAQGLPITDRRIQITVGDQRLSISDDGIGMTEDVLRRNFWKAGSSGKKSDLAQRSGVIGTFGIGAMANFGVCTALQVESRSIESTVTLVTGGRRSELRIAQDCIDLERLEDSRQPGTIIKADLDPAFAINEVEAARYLKQYVRFLRVPVYVNDKIISQEKFQDRLGNAAAGFEEISRRQISDGHLSGVLCTYINAQARILARVTNIAVNYNSVGGEAFFMQGKGRTLGFRNLFGLAPIPTSGIYNFGGIVNVDILKPTAGREALSRDSIQFVANLMSLIEREASKDIAQTDAADRNQQFQQYILSHGLVSLAKNVQIAVLPGRDRQVSLGHAREFEPTKQKLFYAGRDATIQRRFSGEGANLLHVSQVNPRRNLQLRFLRKLSVIREVPDRIDVEPVPQTQLTLEEAMFLVRLKAVLLDDYFMPHVDVSFATISHGVSLQIKGKGEGLQIAVARDMPAVRMVVEAYRSAPEVFHGFMIDYVRANVYPQIRDRVPSSERQGRDALFRRLKENEELFRYDLSDFGEAESLLADYLAGKTDLEQVMKSSAARLGGQRQEVRLEQVGTVEEELPDIIGTGTDDAPTNAYAASPPIVRADVISDKKVLTVRQEHSKLNGFRMFLALSERLTLREGGFLRQPHTTKVMWGRTA